MTLFDQINAAPKSPAIYQIVCTANGRRYVGSAVNLRKRWGEHFRQLSEARHHSQHMQRAWSKHGPEAFTFSVIEHCAREELIGREQFHIDSMTPEFNTSPTAGSQLGYRHTRETKLKLSESAKRTRNFTGCSHTDESKRLISENRKGKGGTGWTQERRDRIGAAHKGRIKTPEHRAAISATLTGHKQSAGQIEKRMKKLRGRKRPQSACDANRAFMLGRKLPADHCQSIGKSKAKLTDEQVREVRNLRAAGVPRKDLAVRFNIDAASITQIVKRTSYRWVS